MESEPVVWWQWIAVAIGLIGNGGLGLYIRNHAIRQKEHDVRIEKLEEAENEAGIVRRDCQAQFREQMRNNIERLETELGMRTQGEEHTC